MLAWFQELLAKFGSLLMMVLPTSPLKPLYTNWEVPEGVAWLNWFVPVHDIVVMFAAWVAAYAVYLLYRIILRWLKAVS